MPIRDDGETTGLFEPLLVSESSKHRGKLADLVRSMNCYYSNLIEGHNTHPVDIERALMAALSRPRLIQMLFGRYTGAFAQRVVVCE
ncbi:hypothetical protein CES85_5275 [Ochrobactrum quorumnocens]|uniref:Uncharacterized protein n=1 Tax=Ochrobactrum quorumnocens TaxID=271865 RepID=A0A248UDL1_9HYPH|nr:hypothetical protein CES85_5275 [[Ochrobactrum] quorumnocens]